MASGCGHIEHVRTQMPYALLVGTVTIGVGTIPGGYGPSPLISILVGAALLYGVLRFSGVRPMMQFLFQLHEGLIMRLVVLVLSLFISAGIFAQNGGVADKIRAAMESDVRSEADLVRDRNRMPVETLEFFGLEDDMRVMEMLPGGGWYTKLLAPVLRENGELYVAIGTNNVRDRLMTQPGFDHVKIVDVEGQDAATGPLDFDVNNLDLILTFRNMHNYSEDERLNVNAAVFAALNTGGHYGVIDHSRRHMAPSTDANSRRADVVQIIKEAQASGFVLEDYSDLHYRPDDELRYEVGRATVTGNTDRFTLLFRKP